MVYETEYASIRQLISWVLSWRENAQLIAPTDAATAGAERMELLATATAGHSRSRRSSRAPCWKRTAAPPAQAARGTAARRSSAPSASPAWSRSPGLMIGAAREGTTLSVAHCLRELNMDIAELREDIDVLNVVNFGGGTYVLYAEIVGDQIEVDPDTYGDNFDRPARLLPLEAKALVAAIDLFGDHLPQAGLATAREKIVEALGHDPSEEGLEIAPGRDDSHVVRTVNQAIHTEPHPRARLLQGERGQVRHAPRRAVSARERSRGLVSRLLRPRPRRTRATSGSTG